MAPNEDSGINDTLFVRDCERQKDKTDTFFCTNSWYDTELNVLFTGDTMAVLDDNDEALVVFDCK